MFSSNTPRIQKISQGWRQIPTDLIKMFLHSWLIPKIPWIMISVLILPMEPRKKDPPKLWERNIWLEAPHLFSAPRRQLELQVLLSRESISTRLGNRWGLANRITWTLPALNPWQATKEDPSRRNQYRVREERSQLKLLKWWNLPGQRWAMITRRTWTQWERYFSLSWILHEKIWWRKRDQVSWRVREFYITRTHNNRSYKIRLQIHQPS